MTVSRQKRYRLRRDNGRAIYQTELNTVNLEHLLEVARMLPVGVDHTHDDVETALTNFIEVLIKETRDP